VGVVIDNKLFVCTCTIKSNENLRKYSVTNITSGFLKYTNIHTWYEMIRTLSSERRVLRLSQINRANFNPDPNKRHFKVCSDHFISGMNIFIFKKKPINLIVWESFFSSKVSDIEIINFSYWHKIGHYEYYLLNTTPFLSTNFSEMSNTSLT
jgi:hypothetical protein